MPKWDEILKEINSTPAQTDIVRRKYLKQLSEHTTRHTIAYYSGWMVNQGAVDINDEDINGFMNSIGECDRNNGMDLILHTPGGNPTATESIVNYLRSIFGTNIRVIVPQIAMSA